MLYIKIIGGLNQGATLTIEDENTVYFSSIGDAPSNYNFTPALSEFTYNGATTKVSITNVGGNYIKVYLEGLFTSTINLYPLGYYTSGGFDTTHPLLPYIEDKTFFKYEFNDGSYFLVGNRSYYGKGGVIQLWTDSTLVIPSIIFFKGMTPFNKEDKYGNSWEFDGETIKINTKSIVLRDNAIYWFYVNEGTKNIAFSSYALGVYNGTDNHRVSFIDGINNQYDSTYAESITESSEYVQKGYVGLTINYVKNDTFGGSILLFGGTPNRTDYGYVSTLFFGNGISSELFSLQNDLPSSMPVYDIGDYTPIPYPPDDPFTPGGTTGGDDTETEGGTGDFDGEGDAIAEPELPSLSSTDSGFLSLFNPTLAQVQALGAFMWSENFVLDTFKKLFSDPMQAILGLSIVPVSPSATTTVSVVLGNVDTGVSMPLITNQYVHKELGTITLSEYWGAYLDYSPYTKVEIYLPYIGVKTLNTDDVMGKTLKLSYNIDLLTGACVALLVVGGSLLYQFTGACASSVPITANDWTNVINGILSTAGKVAAVAMTGGLSSSLLPGSVSSTASTVSSMKPNVEKSGTMQGMPGLLASDRPFLIVTRPRQALPTNQKHYTGYPSFVTRTLGSVTGYTVVDDIHLDGMTCTDTEKEEIRRLLKEGVIL